MQSGVGERGERNERFAGGRGRRLTSAMVPGGPGESRGTRTGVRPGSVRALGVDAAGVGRSRALVDVRAGSRVSADVAGSADARVVAHRVHALRVRAARRRFALVHVCIRHTPTIAVR